MSIIPARVIWALDESRSLSGLGVPASDTFLVLDNAMSSALWKNEGVLSKDGDASFLGESATTDELLNTPIELYCN
jgi:hypothetical protein